MKIYIDLLILTNFIFDFILLLTVSIILKRNVKIYRIILGTLVGSVTIITLFVRLSNLSLIIFKLLVGVLMSITVYGFENIRYMFKNTYYIFLVSTIIAGFIYFINNQFDKKVNIVLEIIISLIGIKIYIKNIKNLKSNYNKYLNIKLFFKDYNLDLVAFLDTGNKLFDPYFYRPIILVNESVIKKKDKVILVPYKTCNKDGILECIKAEKILIEGIEYKSKFLIGLIDDIKLDGINCILNESLLEG